jgi:hypothetical protein
VSLDGIGDIHEQVRHVRAPSTRPAKRSWRWKRCLVSYATFQFGLASTIFAANLEDAGNDLAWARAKKLDIVFNMLRFNRRDAEHRSWNHRSASTNAKRPFMREFLPRAGSGRVHPLGSGISVPPLRRDDCKRLPSDDAVPVF